MFLLLFSQNRRCPRQFYTKKSKSRIKIFGTSMFVLSSCGLFFRRALKHSIYVWERSGAGKSERILRRPCCHVAFILVTEIQGDQRSISHPITMCSVSINTMHWRVTSLWIGCISCKWKWNVPPVHRSQQAFPQTSASQSQEWGSPVWLELQKTTRTLIIVDANGSFQQLVITNWDWLPTRRLEISGRALESLPGLQAVVVAWLKFNQVLFLRPVKTLHNILSSFYAFNIFVHLYMRLRVKFDQNVNPFQVHQRGEIERKGWLWEIFK